MEFIREVNSKFL